MGTMNRGIRIAASAMGAQQSCLFVNELAYGDSVRQDGGVVMSQRWHGLNETIKKNVIVNALTHPAPAPIKRRTVLAPYPERPPV